METPKQKKQVRLFIKNRNKETDPVLSGNITDENGSLIFNLILWERKSKAGETYYKGYVNEPK